VRIPRRHHSDALPVNRSLQRLHEPWRRACAVQARHRLSKPLNDLYTLDVALKVTARSPASLV
jgi:hypothetical protein